MRLALVSVLLLTACGRIGFSSAPLPGDSGPNDSGPADSSTPPADARAPRDTGETPPRDAATDADAAGSLGDSAADSGGGTADAGSCDESPCRLVAPQCGCAGTSVCQRPGGDTPTRACVAPGPSAVGETCLVNNGCEEAAVCVATGFTTGLCHSYCAGPGDCASDFCLELIVTSEDIGACVHVCDPVAASPCAGGTACGLALAQSVPDRVLRYATVCRDPGLPALGEACPDFACGPGLSCVGSSCRQACELPAGACPGALTCQALSPRATIGSLEYGVCR